MDQDISAECKPTISAIYIKTFCNISYTYTYTVVNASKGNNDDMMIWCYDISRSKKGPMGQTNFFIIKLNPMFLWKKMVIQLQYNFNHNDPKMVCVKRGWNIGQLVPEKKIVKSYLCHFVINFSLKKGMTYYLNQIACSLPLENFS